MKCNYQSYQRQHGVTLLMAMLLVVIVTSLLVSIGSTSFFDIRRSGVLNHLQAAQAYNESAIATAKQILKNDSAVVDSFEDDWAKRLPPYPLDGGQIHIYINENSSKLNLYPIKNDSAFYREAFLRLCTHLEVEQTACNTVIEIIQDEDNEIYSLLGIYQHSKLTAETLDKLLPYIAYLDVDEKLNINIVSEEVFAAVNDISLSKANTYLREREQAVIEGGQQGVQNYLTQITGKLSERRDKIPAFRYSQSFFSDCQQYDLGGCQTNFIGGCPTIYEWRHDCP